MYVQNRCDERDEKKKIETESHSRDSQDRVEDRVADYSGGMYVTYIPPREAQHGVGGFLAVRAEIITSFWVLFLACMI